jgi:DoxX-like family
MNTQTLSSAGPSKGAATSRKQIRTGRIVSVLVVLFMLMDGIMKLFKPSFVVEANARLGYPESTVVGIGAALLACTVLYVIPRTSILGAILLTGYLGGAVASNVRAAQGLFNVIFPLIFCVLVWGGLWLRDSRLRNLVPLANE